MIKIARIISRLNIGGPAQHAIMLSEYLQDSEWQTKLISGVEDPMEGNMLSLAKERNVQVIRITSMARKIKVFSDFISFFRLVQILRKYKPQILHTHTAKAGALGRAAGIVSGIPIKIHTFHGHTLNGYFSNWISKIFIFIEKQLAKRSDCIVTLTEKLKDELTSMGIVGKKGVRVISLGLDLDRFSLFNTHDRSFRKELNLHEQDLLIGIVGRLVPIKRHEDLLRALAQLREKGLKVHLAIVGGGELKDFLRNLVQELRLENLVHFCGFRKDLEQIYSELNCLVLCSANEGTPVCLIEAMASGIPVIATDVGGVRDLLLDCPSCKITPSKDPPQLAQAMEEILQKYDFYKEKAQSYRSVISERYSIKNLVGSLKTLYEELLRSS